jgi:hypothetical protein
LWLFQLHVGGFGRKLNKYTRNNWLKQNWQKQTNWK